MQFSFAAHVIFGSRIGSSQGIPTINLALRDVPVDLDEGIYACRIAWKGKIFSDAVMHYGPRPVHHLPLSCEMHVIDTTIPSAPETVEVKVVQRMRDIREFPSAKALHHAIMKDIGAARKILDDDRE